MNLLKLPIFPADCAVIIFTQQSMTDSIASSGRYIALTRQQLEEGCAVCGVFAEAVIILDESLPEDLINQTLKPMLAASHFSRYQKSE